MHRRAFGLTLAAATLLPALPATAQSPGNAVARVRFRIDGRPYSLDIRAGGRAGTWRARLRQGNRTLKVQRWRLTGGDPVRAERALLDGQAGTVRVLGQTVAIIAQPGREAVRLRIRPGERAEVEAVAQAITPAAAFGAGLLVGSLVMIAAATAGAIVGLAARTAIDAAQRLYAEVTTPTAPATYEAEDEDDTNADGDEPASDGGGEAGSEGE